MAIVNTYTSNTTVSIPDNAYNVIITVGSANGGAGANAPTGGSISTTRVGGLPGNGRIGTFKFKTDFVARTLQVRIGQAGANGLTYLQVGEETASNCRGRISNVGSGGCGGGGNFLPRGTGGGILDQVESRVSEGGSGAGATGLLTNGGAGIIIAGGGGGGTGGYFIDILGDIYTNNGKNGNSAGSFQAVSGSVPFSNGGYHVYTADGSNSVVGTSGGGGGGSPGAPNLPQGYGTNQFIPQACGGGGSRYDSNLVDFISQSTNNSTTAFVTVSYEISFVDITSFTANPSLQTSGSDGIPNYDTTLSWVVNSVIFPLTYTITSGTFTTSGTTNTTAGNVTITNLPQSEAGVTSPATRTYTLTMTDGATSDTSSVTVSVYNDNTPNNYTIPDQNNVEPSTVITIQIGPITGIDMLTNVTGGSGVSVSNNNINYSSFTTVQNNQDIYIRVTSLPFNTSPDGLTNSSTHSITIGTLQRFFTVTTRAPDVNETFNYSNESDYVPYPDIDTIPDPDADIRNQSNPYIQTDTLLVDDVELGNPYGVEIKSSDPNVQIRVKRFGQSVFGGWQDVRSI